MPFIGTQPDVGGYSVLDALTASATASYTLQLNSANFVPSSANQLLVSLNGVIQKPGSSFTVSGSTLTFSSALSSSDSIDFILAMGEPLLVGTPSDGAVNTTQLATNAVSSAKIASSAVTDAKIAAMTATKLTGTVSNARFPAGSVVQVVRSENIGNSTFNTTNTTPQDTGHSVAITPQFSDSDILVQLHTIGGQTDAGRSYKLRVNRTVGGGSDTVVSSFHLGDNGTGVHYTQIGCIVYDTSVSNTSERVYRTLVGTDSQGTARYNYQSAQSFSQLIAMEIKR